VSADQRITRGGWWNATTPNMAAAGRQPVIAEGTGNSLGFRCAYPGGGS
jgi:formylglycine-generating enzyme required for sulfatase activity